MRGGVECTEPPRHIICFGKVVCRGNHHSSLESGRTLLLVVEPLHCLMAREEYDKSIFERGKTIK